MADFIMHFLLCNIFISGIVILLLIVKQLFKNILTSRMQYNLWFVLLALLVIPFLPLSSLKSILPFSWLRFFENLTFLDSHNGIKENINPHPSDTIAWMNNFTQSVNRETHSTAGFLLCGLWIIGISAMIIWILKSYAHLNTLKKSALPLQHKEIHKLYRDCLNEMNITASIPIYSTAFLKSPIIVGLFQPCIYLPIHLISDYKKKEIRYMLLHELQHYKYKDGLSNYLMNLTRIFYWFNPIIWYALKEMSNDREVACDTSVLKMLDEEYYEDYGTTLIDFAEKISLTAFPFAANLTGSMRQMKRRILNITSYSKPSIPRKICGFAAFGVIAILLITSVPNLSAYVTVENYNSFSAKNVSYIDLSAYFNGYDGSFVLYDLEQDSFYIYNMEHAIMRVSPNSTYKIYNALFGLERGIITPENSSMAWNKEIHPIKAWNSDQTLQSAMQLSVNWYFQSINEQLGYDTVNSYIHEIGYGNKMIRGNFSSYWMESSLKISPIEQVELLTKLYHNDFGFALKNIDAVKDSIFISSSENGNLYGKTGTGRINEQDINGWFIGYVEQSEHTYFFATNIQSDKDATGSHASEISFSILSDRNIWK